MMDELDHDAMRWNLIMISSLCLSMICAQTRFRVCRVENRFPLFRIMLWPGSEILFTFAA